MRTADFDYELPPDRIAQTPLPERDQARMMVLKRQTATIAHARVADLPHYLQPGDSLVLNDTRVIPARLLGRRADTGGRVELLLVEPVDGAPMDPQQDEAQDRGEYVAEWKALWRASGRLGPGTPLELAAGHIRAVVISDDATGCLRLRLFTREPLRRALDRVGLPPLPPYIRRNGEKDDRIRMDRERYQTVFARHPGAVAAPTAGLHFTETLLAQLEEKGIERVSVTLHVGPGTFRPVRVEQICAHRMEPERYAISEEAAAALEAARQAGRRLVAVGTTVVRTLEQVVAEKGRVVAGSGFASLFIYPPFAFRAVGALFTNFHLPRSTLLMLVSAFVGRAEPGASEADRNEQARAGWELLRRAYREAIREGYRFYSYGDAMLIV